MTGSNDDFNLALTLEIGGWTRDLRFSPAQARLSDLTASDTQAALQ
jgi:hypothetical protein